LGTAANVVATAFDSEDVVCKKYPDAESIILDVKEFQGTILYDVDATQLEKCSALKNKIFSKVVFNFPHVRRNMVTVCCFVFWFPLPLSNLIF
jgi:25S rRNA (uracil2634-N3)-methyltransferase